MATLTGNAINTSYQGLTKTADNAAIGATEKNITDGVGNASTLNLGTNSASFTGTLDLSGATVTGLPADVNTTYDLASAQNGADVDVTLTGSDASVDTIKLVAGSNVTLADDGSNNITVTATDTNTTYTYTITQNGANIDLELVGSDTTTDLVIAKAGTNITLTQDGPSSFVIDAVGGLVNDSGLDSLKQNDALTGTAATASGTRAIALGNGASATGANTIAIGRSASASASQNGLAFGAFASATADGSVALGQAVTAATADTVSVKALEVQTDSTPTTGGIIISDAGGTDRRLNIDSSGNLQIDASPVGGAAGLESGTGTDSMQSAASLTSQAAVASGTRAIALGNDADALAEDGIAIGNTAYASGITNIAIGDDARAEGDTAFARRNIAIGHNSTAQNENALAVGVGTLASAATSTAVGFNAQATGLRGLALGLQAQATAFSSMAAGNYTQATAEGAISLGGFNTNATQTNAIAIGKETNATASGAIALGAGVTGNIANTLSTKAIELQTDSTPTAGGIIMSDAGSTDRRINITSTGDLQIDSTPVLTQTNAFATGGQTAPMSGYGATYWTSCSLITGRPAINGAMPDQGANIAMLTKFDIDYTKTVTTIGVPMPVVLTSENLYVAVYESASNGGPGVRVWEETKAITTSDDNTWVEVTLSTPWTPEKGKSYWIGAMTPSGNSLAALGYMGGEHASAQRFTTTNNSSVGTMIAIHTLRVSTSGSAMPTDLSSTTFGHRDEEVFFAWK